MTKKELRYQNGNPAKKWVIQLPAPAYKVVGDIRVRLERPRDSVKAKAVYDIIRRRGKPNVLRVIITFNETCDGWAFLEIEEGRSIVDFVMKIPIEFDGQEAT